MDNLNEFERLVKTMRDWQKRYFRMRGALELAMSKETERKVDEYLAWKTQQNPELKLK